MQQQFFAAVFLLFVATHAAAQTDTAGDAILHTWITQEKDGKMQMVKTGDTYAGKMVYGKELLETDGKTYKIDIHNPDTTLRSRSLKDYDLLTGLTYKDGKWSGGKCYDYKTGNSYDVYLELKNGAMYMRVYKGVTMFGRTLKWDLVE
jgi:uncharacterized protein (DUF2147 family)